MGVNTHSILAEIANDGDAPRLGQADGERGGRGAGAYDGAAKAARLVEHFAGYAAAAEQNVVAGVHLLLQGCAAQSVKRVVTADIFNLQLDGVGGG